MTHIAFKEYLEIFMLLVGVFSVSWQIARVKLNVLEIIDKVSDQSYARYAELDARLRIHVAECTAKEKHVNSCIRELKLRTEIERDSRNL